MLSAAQSKDSEQPSRAALSFQSSSSQCKSPPDARSCKPVQRDNSADTSASASKPVISPSATHDASASTKKRERAIVVGAGTAGLSAARRLADSGLLNGVNGIEDSSVVILEARDRPGGRVLTKTLPAMSEFDLPEIHVDIGASIMHGCGDEPQSVFKLALQEKIRAPVVAGGLCYECTEHARWFDSCGNPIDTRIIVEMHTLFWMIGRCLAAMARTSDDFTADLEGHYVVARDYVLQSLGGRVLSDIEGKVLNKIKTRSYGYCAPLARMALHQAALSADPSDDPVIASAGFLDDDLGVEHAASALSSSRIHADIKRLKKELRSADNPCPSVASRRNLPGDRIVLDGYTPFLIDKLKTGLDIRCNSVVREILYQRSNTEYQKSAVEVLTADGERYEADFVIVTLPIGVLQSRNDKGSVKFVPPLSEHKNVAIHSLGMGVHNKVILRFHPDDVFWPAQTPQINCLDERFQFFNLHAYGKRGVLLTHVFGGTGFARGYDGLSDSQVVSEILTVLKSMFYASDGLEASARSNDLRGKRCCKDEPVSDDNALRVVASTPPVRSCDGEHSMRSAANRERPNLPENSDVVLNGSDQKTRNACLVGDEGVVDGPCLAGSGHSGMGESEDANACGENSICDRTFCNKRLGRVVKCSRARAQYEQEVAQRGMRRQSSKRRRKPLKFPEPLQTLVTRWDQDPFSLGSYSYLPCGAEWEMLEQMSIPEPPNVARPTLYFAGEHCDDLGWQCVHGAFESGRRAADAIIESLSHGDDDSATRMT